MRKYFLALSIPAILGVGGWVLLTVSINGAEIATLKGRQEEQKFANKSEHDLILEGQRRIEQKLDQLLMKGAK